MILVQEQSYLLGIVRKIRDSSITPRRWSRRRSIGRHVVARGVLSELFLRPLNQVKQETRCTESREQLKKAESGLNHPNIFVNRVFLESSQWVERLEPNSKSIHKTEDQCDPRTDSTFSKSIWFPQFPDGCICSSASGDWRGCYI